jgi:hypothetical protein
MKLVQKQDLKLQSTQVVLAQKAKRLVGRSRVKLLELTSFDNEFANAVKMLVIKGQSDGLTTIPMKQLVGDLNRMGYSASGNVDAIRQLISTFKAKNNNLVADVNNDAVILTTVPTADNKDKAQQNKEKVSKDAVSQAQKELGI